jgi:hypothetical protein
MLTTVDARAVKSLRAPGLLRSDLALKASARPDARVNAPPPSLQMRLPARHR